MFGTGYKTTAQGKARSNTHNGSYAQDELAKRFFDGETTGKASNVKIVETDNETLLVGYNWAVYAARNKDTGETTYYKGWYGYSPSTSSQLTRMGLEVKADNIVNDKRKR